MNQNKLLKQVLLAFSVISLLTPFVYAQESDTDELDEDIFELSPFTVESDTDEGYRATSTLAGTRIRTDLKDIASPLSVITKQFLEDTGATNNQTLLMYTANTEVGGFYGNFAGTGNTQGVGERNLGNPSSNTRVRGLDAADNTRNYFLTDIPWDGYIVDRVDLQRGPNSILFGVGSPAGIINTGTIVPKFENAGKLENRIGSYGSTRHALDYNHVLVEDRLAVRVAGLMRDTKFKQKPAFEEDERVFAAITYQPKWFGPKVNTNFNANFESGKITANRPRMLTPVDQITPWWTGLGQTVWDAQWSWAYGAQIDRGNAGKANANPWVNQPWLGESMGAFQGAGPTFVYHHNSSVPIDIRAGEKTTRFGINPDGVIDTGINDFVFGRLQTVAGFNEYTRNAEADALARGVANPYPSAASNFYKDKHLTNPGVFDFYNILIDGDNKRETSDWTAYNMSLNQTFFSNRLGWELVYDYQDYESGNFSILGWRPSIRMDINTHRGLLPAEYPTAIPEGEGGGVPEPSTVQGGDINPYVGRAYVAGGRPTYSSNRIQRINTRLTVFGEWQGADLFREDSFFAKLLGRHVVTGLMGRDERRIEELAWNAFATDLDYATSLDLGTQLDSWTRGVSYLAYLSDDLRGVSSPWDLNLPGLSNIINPKGSYRSTFFDSRWNAPDVDPAAFHRNVASGAESTQSENTANYVGLSQMNANILNQDENRDELYTNAFKRTEVLDSVGVTYQAYFWDGMVVPTVGWREDTLETWGASSQADRSTGVRNPNFDNPKTDDTLITKGETVTWGVVAHSDQILRESLPMNTNFSVFYNESENFRADNRVGFSGASLPNPSGESQDYGIVINTLDDKLTLKITWYNTEVTDANVGSGSPLGNNTWFLANIEAWGTAASLTHELYWAGELPGMSGRSNPGMIDENRWGQAGWADAPFSDEARNHPSNVEQFAALADWYATMPPQEFFDAYGLDIDVSKAQGTLDDRRTMVEGGRWDPRAGIGSIQPSGGGRVNGLSPTLTINQESKGVEFEVQYRPMPNWNITMNASKTEATRTDLGAEITNWINYQYNRFQGPAGDLRMWWGGDSTIRKYYNDFIYQAYLFQLDANGQSAAEIRPWRFNIVTNYSFQDGVLRGFSVGGAYRWQDDSILGYELSDDFSKLDVTRPIHGGAEANFDMWAGYQTALTDKIEWRLQLNLRNVGDDFRLIPVSVNPNGEMAVGRIAEGMAWELTSTFTF